MKSKLFLFVVLLLCVSATMAYAGTDGKDSLPFESGLTKVANSLSGPVAMSIAIVAFAAAGIMYMFNPDSTALIKGLIGLSIAVGILLGGAKMITLVTGKKVTANTIPVELIIKQEIIKQEKVNE